MCTGTSRWNTPNRCLRAGAARARSSASSARDRVADAILVKARFSAVVRRYRPVRPRAVRPRRPASAGCQFIPRSRLQRSSALRRSLDDGVRRHAGDAALAHDEALPPVLIRIKADPRPRTDLHPLVEDRATNLRPTADAGPIEQDAVFHDRVRGDPAIEPDDRPPEPAIGDRAVRDDVVPGPRRPPAAVTRGRRPLGEVGSWGGSCRSARPCRTDPGRGRRPTGPCSPGSRHPPFPRPANTPARQSPGRRR